MTCLRASLLASVVGASAVAMRAGDALPPASPSALATIETGVRSIPFAEGDPSSLAWDAQHDVLYIADNENNQIWSWTEGQGLRRLTTTPDPLDAKAARATLAGQIVQRADGTLVVMRFGKPGGGFGGVAYVHPVSGAAGVVPNLDPARKRLGLTVASAGQLFGSYFRATADGGHESAVTRIDLKAGESDFASGFKKIVGLLAEGDKLYVSDQDADAIFVLPLTGSLPAPAAYRVFARVARPDQLALGPDGSLFTGQFRAAPGSSAPLAVRQVLLDGTVKVFATSPEVTRPNGLAFDGRHRRLFVANGGDPAQRSVRILPVP